MLERKNELNKQKQTWALLNTWGEALSYQLQCLSDAYGVILKFVCIWTNKKLYIVEKQQPDHHQ